ncbi:hypothetical protein HYW60_03375 [Candidatus Kaiserbacteria bacterium]|nr:hypothetical protein [Candidatus Kaiserbacteria bacterium]
MLEKERLPEKKAGRTDTQHEIEHGPEVAEVVHTEPQPEVTKLPPDLSESDIEDFVKKQEEIGRKKRKTESAGDS